MRRGLIFLLIISLLLVGQAAHAKEKKEDVKEWKTITRVSEKQATYSLVQHEETEELYFVKEKGNKGKKEEQYQSFLGTYEGRVQAKIMNKKEKAAGEENGEKKRESKEDEKRIPGNTADVCCSRFARIAIEVHRDKRDSYFCSAQVE